MISCANEEELAEFLKINISKIKTPLRKPPVHKKVQILQRIFGQKVTEEFYIKAAKLAGFHYSIFHSRHYVDDSSPSWIRLEKFADWIREHGDVSESKLAKLEEVTAITGLTKFQLDALELAGTFPKRVKVSRKLSYWHMEEVDSWLLAQ